jgi:hypothetical protein
MSVAIEHPSSASALSSSMSSTTSSFDIMAIVQELIVCLNGADEPKLVSKIRDQQSELRRLHEKQQQELKDIVTGATGRTLKVCAERNGHFF